MIARRSPASPGHDSNHHEIRAAAEATGLSEFDLFRAAYRHWYNADPDTRALEARFAAYLFEGTVPPFVRHYARLVRDGRAGGAETRGLRRREPPVQPDALFIAVLLVLTLVVYLLFGSG